MQAGGRRFEPVRLHLPALVGLGGGRCGLPIPLDLLMEDGFVAEKFEVRWFTVSSAMRYDDETAVGDPPAVSWVWICVLCQCESGSGASLGAHAFMRSDRQVGSWRFLSKIFDGVFGALLFWPIFPDWSTRGSGNYVQRRCGDLSVDEAGGSHVCMLSKSACRVWVYPCERVGRVIVGGRRPKT